MAFLTKRSGTEGPRHDPYHYDEFIVTKRGRTAILHLGLTAWLSIDGQRWNWIKGSTAESNSIKHFEHFCGCSLEAVEKAWDRLTDPPKCPSCGLGRNHRVSCGGFPGEELVQCTCGAIVSSFCDRSAIE